MWGKVLIGGIGDQIGHIIWGQISNTPFKISNPSLANYSIYQTYFSTQLRPWFSSQSILWTLLSLGPSWFGPNAYNVFLIINLVLNLYFSYRLFKRFKNPWFYTLIFNFSSYFWIHFGEHIGLTQIWIYCLIFEQLLDTSWLNKPLKTILLLVLGSLISNYLGLFSLIFFIFYSVIYTFVEHRNMDYIKSYKSIIKVIAGYILVISIFLFPYIKANYISPQNVNEVGSRSLQRTLEDYVTFSSRPWYYVIPSVKNPFYGRVATNIYNKILGTGNYLTDDYFVYEHSANYLGLSFYIFFVCLLFLNSRKKRSSILKTLIISSILVFVFTMPPVVTIKGINFYNINFLLYKFAPFFRVMSRMSVLIHLSLLIIAGYILKDIKLKPWILGLLMITILIETYVPLRIGKLIEPRVYTYMHDNIISSEKLFVYPYSKTKDAMVWLPVHEQLLVNPKNYVRDGFSSEIFTKEFFDEPDDFYNKLVNLEVRYMVNYDSSTYSMMSLDEFNVVENFEDCVLYEILE